MVVNAASLDVSVPRVVAQFNKNFQRFNVHFAVLRKAKNSLGWSTPTSLLVSFLVRAQTFNFLKLFRNYRLKHQLDGSARVPV